MTEDHWKARVASGKRLLFSSCVFLLLLEGCCLGQSNNGGDNGANFFYYYSPTQGSQLSHGITQGNIFSNGPYFAQQSQLQQQGPTQPGQFSASTTQQSPQLGFHQTTQASSIFTQPPLGHYNFQFQNGQQNTPAQQDDQQLPQPTSSFTTFTRFGHDLFANRGLLPVSTPQQSYYAHNPQSFFESPFQFIQNRYIQNHQLAPTLAPPSPTQNAPPAPSTTMTPPPPLAATNGVVMNDADSIVVPAAAPVQKRRKKQRFSSRFRYVTVQPQVQQYNPYSNINSPYSNIPYVEQRFYNDAVPSAPTPTGYSYSLGDEKGTSRSSVHVSMGPSANIQQHLTEITATRNRILQRQRELASTTLAPFLNARAIVRSRVPQIAPTEVSSEAPVETPAQVVSNETPVTEPPTPTSTPITTTTTTTEAMPQEPEPSPVPTFDDNQSKPVTTTTASPSSSEPTLTTSSTSAPEEPSSLNETSSIPPSIPVVEAIQEVSQNLTAEEPLLNEPSFQSETIAIADPAPVEDETIPNANPNEEPEDVSKKINGVNIPKRLVIRKKVARKRLRLDSVEISNKDPEAVEFPSPSPIPIRRRIISPNRIPQENKEDTRESPAVRLRSQFVRTTTTAPTTTTTPQPTSTTTTETPSFNEYDSSLTEDKTDEQQQEQDEAQPVAPPTQEQVPVEQGSQGDYHDQDQPMENDQPENKIEPISTAAPIPAPVEESVANPPVPSTETPVPAPSSSPAPVVQQPEYDDEYYDEYEDDSIPQQQNDHVLTPSSTSSPSESGELPVLPFLHKEDFPGVFRNHSGADGDNSIETDKGEIITRQNESHPLPEQEEPVKVSTPSTTATEEPSNVPPFMREDPPEEMPPAHEDEIPEPVFQPITTTTESIPVMTPSSTTPAESNSQEESGGNDSSELDDQAPLVPPATEQLTTSTEPISSSTTSPQNDDYSDEEVSVEDRREHVLMMEGMVTTTAATSSTTEFPMVHSEAKDEARKPIIEDEQVNIEGNGATLSTETSVASISTEESLALNDTSSTEGSVSTEVSVSSTEGPTINENDFQSLNGSSTESPVSSSTETAEETKNAKEDFSSYSQEIPEGSQEGYSLTQSEEDSLSSDEEIGKAQRLALEETLRRLRERQQQQTEDPLVSTETPLTPAPIVRGGRPFMRRRLQLANLSLPTSGPVPNINAVLGDDHVDRSQVIEKIQRFRSNFRRVTTTTKRPRRVTRPSTGRTDDLDQIDSFSESSSAGMNDPSPSTTPISTTTAAPTTTTTTTTPTPFSPMTTSSTEPSLTTMISSTETVTYMESEPITTSRSTTSSTTLSPFEEEEETMTTTQTPIPVPMTRTTTTSTTTTMLPPTESSTTMTPDFYENDNTNENKDDDVYYAEDYASNEETQTAGSSTEISSTTTSTTTTTEIPDDMSSPSSTEPPFSSTTTPPEYNYITTAEPLSVATTTSTSEERSTTTTEAIGQLIIHEILPTMPPLKEVSFVIGDSVEEDHSSSSSLEEPKSVEYNITDIHPNVTTNAIVRVETKVEVRSSADSTNDSDFSNELSQPKHDALSSSEENGERAEVSTRSPDERRKVRVIKRQRKVGPGSGTRRRRKVIHNQNQRRRRPSRPRRRPQPPPASYYNP